MYKSLTAASVALLLVACGGSGSGGVQDTNEFITPGIGSALPDATDTRTLEVDRSFAFATARTIDIEFDIESARNADATVSICTDFVPVASEFDVDFDSCTVSGELDNGMFSHSMDVTNDKNSVVGVVLFQSAEMPPLYKEFNVDENQRTKGDGTVQSVIVWK